MTTHGITGGNIAALLQTSLLEMPEESPCYNDGEANTSISSAYLS